MEPKGDGHDDHDSSGNLDGGKGNATDKIELPRSFEQCDIDHLVVLIGVYSVSSDFIGISSFVVGS